MTRIVPPVEILAESCAQHLLTQIGETVIADPGPLRAIEHATRLETGATTAPLPLAGSVGPGQSVLQ